MFCLGNITSKRKWSTRLAFGVLMRKLRLNPSTTSTLGPEECGRCRKVAVSGGSVVFFYFFYLPKVILCLLLVYPVVSRVNMPALSPELSHVVPERSLWPSWVICWRSDFIYDIVEHLKPSVPVAGTKKSSRKRPTVSSQFKVSSQCCVVVV